MRIKTDWLITGGLFLASLALYLGTLAPSVVTIFDDSLEFQLVVYRLGIAHPTGYPLYTLLGKLFTLLPLGDIAYRVNLMSAIFGASTVAGLYLLIVQVRANGLSPRRWTTVLGGIIGAALLAVSQVFWQQATIAEVYTLNAFFIVTLLLLVTRTPLPSLYCLTALAGLSLTHHRSMILLLPGLAVYLYLTRAVWRLTWKTIIWGGLLGLLPLLLYLYLPLRGQVGSLDGTYQNTWAGFWRQTGGGGYGAFIFGNPLSQERDAAFYWDLFRRQFYTLTPGFIGLFYLLWLGQRRLLTLTGLVFVTYFGFNLFYRVADIEVFFIPPFLVWAVWSGIGAAFLLDIAAGMTADGRRQTAAVESKLQLGLHNLAPFWRLGLTGLIIIIFALVIIQNVAANLPALNERNTWRVHDYGLDILTQPLEDHATIVGIVGEMTLLRYFQETQNRRPDIQTVAADKEADRLAAVESLLGQGKTVYLTRDLPGAAQRWPLSALGPLIRVNPQPITEAPPLPFVRDQVVTPEITLVGYILSRPNHTDPGPAPVRLTVFWQSTAPIPVDLKVSARLFNTAGEQAAATDIVPVHFAYPTTAWRPGEIVADVYDLSLPPGTPTGSYTPLLIWYDPAQNAAEVGRVELEPVIVD